MNLPVSLGTPAFFDIQFDSSVLDSNTTPGAGLYNMSGGLSRISAQIGDFSSLPISNFYVTVLTEPFTVSGFIGFFGSSTNGPLIVDFPGFASGVELLIAFPTPKVPFTSDAIPMTALNPKDFRDELFGLRRGPVGNRTLSLNGTLILHVPEPSSILLAAGLCLPCLRIRRR
jgi:hypothetical protein